MKGLEGHAKDFDFIQKQMKATVRFSSRSHELNNLLVYRVDWNVKTS